MLTLPYPVSANRYWRHFRGRTVRSAEADAYRRTVAATARIAGLQRPFDGGIAVHIVLRPKSRQRASTRPVRCMDLDNSLKVALDALQGIAYDNDAQIVRIVAERGEPVGGGALEVEIRSA